MGTPRERRPIGEHRPIVRGQVLINKDRCKGCELCIEFCPRTVLARSTDLNAKGYHYPVVAKDECINCRLCVTVCPDYAIFSIAAPASGTNGTARPASAAATSGGQA
jgi:2-oxoglutarate ferredoxin oxidoreductase subunit delta